jgi:hypothetical protein
MGTATLEVSGPDAARWAAELHADLTAHAQSTTACRRPRYNVPPTW